MWLTNAFVRYPLYVIGFFMVVFIVMGGITLGL